MSPLQPQNARDLLQRLAELREVEGDLSEETKQRRVRVIVELVRSDPDNLAQACHALFGGDLDRALADTYALLDREEKGPK